MDGDPNDQARIRHIFLTHVHLDHVATLPVFLETAFDPSREPITVYGHPDSLADLQKYIFNGVVWPDFVRLSVAGSPLLTLCPLDNEKPFQVNGLTITPVTVDHLVTTYGYVVTDGASTVVFGGDSGPTEQIWRVLSKYSPPRSVFLEASFPDAMGWLARESYHLTPSLFAEEVAKMPEMHTVLAVHIKPRFYEETVKELMSLKLSNLVVGAPGSDYEL